MLHPQPRFEGRMILRYMLFSKFYQDFVRGCISSVYVIIVRNCCFAHENKRVENRKQSLPLPEALPFGPDAQGGFGTVRTKLSFAIILSSLDCFNKKIKTCRRQKYRYPRTCICIIQTARKNSTQRK